MLKTTWLVRVRKSKVLFKKKMQQHEKNESVTLCSLCLPFGTVYVMDADRRWWKWCSCESPDFLACSSLRMSSFERRTNCGFSANFSIFMYINQTRTIENDQKPFSIVKRNVELDRKKTIFNVHSTLIHTKRNSLH